MESTLELQIGETYLVSSWSAKVAVRFIRYSLEYPDLSEFWDLVCCEDEENQDSCDHSSEMCWHFTGSHIEEGLDAVEDRSFAIVCMIGDDRLHEVSAADLIPVDAEQVCSCGSIGCCFGGSEQ
jgi:hypothetical protein